MPRSRQPTSSCRAPAPATPGMRPARASRGCATWSNAGQPLLAVCLSHQILADRFGIELAPLDAPHQGLQKTVDVFGTPASIGFYNTFTARVAPGTTQVSDGVEVAADAASGDVYALRGPHFASIQGHLESILSRDGLATLERLVTHALA